MNGDQGFAQYIYLANLYAQKGECQCDACQLLRKSTDGMIGQLLGRAGPSSELPLSQAIEQALGAQAGK